MHPTQKERPPTRETFDYYLPHYQLVTSVFFILAAANTITYRTTDYTTNYGTHGAVLFVDDGTCYGTTGTTNHSTFSGFTPPFFGLGGIGRSRTIATTVVAGSSAPAHRRTFSRTAADRSRYRCFRLGFIHQFILRLPLLEFSKTGSVGGQANRVFVLLELAGGFGSHFILIVTTGRHH